MPSALKTAPVWLPLIVPSLAIICAITPEAPDCFSALSRALILASFNLLSVVSADAISFVISPLSIAASTCLFISADLSKFLDIAFMSWFCKLPDLIEPFKSPPYCDIIWLALIKES